ncbi:MAG: TetR/AcrR family transcriptional regulator [Thermoleophilaceae bacterium]
MGAAQAAERPLRSDAARNRERVLAAASELFAQRGMSVGVPAVAQRAGVGKGTVYRSYPTKERLIAAVLERRMAWFERRVEQAASSDDPGAAFFELVGETAEMQAGDRAIADALALKACLPELLGALDAVRAALDRLVVRAQNKGAIRTDVTGHEVRMLLNGVTQVLADAGEHDPQVWRRYMSLVADGLRAGASRAE